MVIQIQRISAQSIHREVYRCMEPHCGVTATWSLVDLAMPYSDEASLGERPCCVEHIPAAYLSLRGAHLIAHALGHASRSRSGIDRRRQRKRKSIPNLGGILARGTG